MLKKLSMLLVTAVVALALSLSGCGPASSERHCERDSTDEVVADSLCEDGGDGYEWEEEEEEEGGGWGKSKKGKKNKKSNRPRSRGRR